VSNIIDNRSIEKERYGNERRSLEKEKKYEEKAIQLPVIPKGKKKKI
jgi:hypothetical protein